MTPNAEFIIGESKAEGRSLVLTEPISFWGGVDPKTGKIINVRHPQFGAKIAQKVLFIPATVGSSSASTILLELVHCGKAPAAIVLSEPDAILLLGLVAAREMGWTTPPALKLPASQHGQFSNADVRIETDGSLHVAQV
ncbi:MAG: DUF126 domain-containing protein [Rhizobiaceae bacterium]